MSAYGELEQLLRNADVGYLDHRYGADAEPAAIADGILKRHDTETLREAAYAVALDRDSTIPSGGKGAYRRGMTRAVELLRRMASAAEQGEKAAPTGTTATPQPAEVTIYRASHDSIVMGHYTNREAARAHCETYVRREFGTACTLGWVPDHGGEDAPEELSVFGPETDGDGVPDETCTGYIVTPLTVTSAYDEEADE